MFGWGWTQSSYSYLQKAGALTHFILDFRRAQAPGLFPKLLAVRTPDLGGSKGQRHRQRPPHLDLRSITATPMGRKLGVQGTAFWLQGGQTCYKEEQIWLHSRCLFYFSLLFYCLCFKNVGCSPQYRRAHSQCWTFSSTLSMHIERSYRTETNILFLSEVYRNIVALPVWTKGLCTKKLASTNSPLPPLTLQMLCHLTL